MAGQKVNRISDERLAMAEDDYDESKTSLITNTLDKDIWWFRDTKAAPAASQAQGEP